MTGLIISEKTYLVLREETEWKGTNTECFGVITYLEIQGRNWT